MDNLGSALLQVIVFSFIPFLWWIITARKKENFLSWIGLKKAKLQGSFIKLILLIVGVSIIYTLLINLVMTHFIGDSVTATSQFKGKGIAALIPILIYAILQTGLSEEILFRGFIGKRAIYKFGFLTGNMVQAILFGLLHGIPFGLVTGDILITVLLTILPGAIGWFQGWMCEKYASGSIIPGWIMHGILNILSGLSMAFL